MFRQFMKKMTACARDNRRRILYYAALAAVLTGAAVFAESYRQIPRTAEVSYTEIPESVQTEAEAFRPEFRLPSAAEILRDYAGLPQWNDVLQQYEAHTGADVHFEDGIVRSVSNGKIRFVGEGRIEVESGEYVFTYRAVEPDASVKGGKEIRPGDALGTEMPSCAGEDWMPPHVHLELRRSGEHCDPLKTM